MGEYGNNNFDDRVRAQEQQRLERDAQARRTQSSYGNYGNNGGHGGAFGAVGDTLNAALHVGVAGAIANRVVAPIGNTAAGLASMVAGQPINIGSNFNTFGVHVRDNYNGNNPNNLFNMLGIGGNGGGHGTDAIDASTGQRFAARRGDGQTDGYGRLVQMVVEAKMTQDPELQQARFAAAEQFGHELARNDGKSGKSRDDDRINFNKKNGKRVSSYMLGVEGSNGPAMITYNGDDLKPQDAIADIANKFDDAMLRGGSYTGFRQSIFRDPQQPQNDGAEQGQGSNTQETGAFAVEFSKRAGASIAATNLATVTPATLEATLGEALGVQNPADALRLRASLSAATPEEREQFKKNLNDGINGLAATIPADQQAAYAPRLAGMHQAVEAFVAAVPPGSVKQGEKPANEQAQGGLTGEERQTELNKAEFDLTTDAGKAAAENYKKILQLDKTTHSGGGGWIMGFITQLINSFTGHPELNASPEEFLATAKANGTVKNADAVLAGLKSTVAPTSPQTEVAANPSPSAPTVPADTNSPAPGTTPPAGAALTVAPTKESVAVLLNQLPGWATATEAPIALASADVKNLQTVLKSVGLYAGALDGINGTNTQEAVQKLEVLTSHTAPDKDIDSKDLMALRSPETKAAIAALVQSGVSGGAEVAGNGQPPGGRTRTTGPAAGK